MHVFVRKLGKEALALLRPPLRSARRYGKKVAAFLRLLFGKAEYGKYNRKHRFLDLFLKRRDDFYWSFYTDHYIEELESVGRTHTLGLRPDDYVFDGKVLSRKTDIPPLHPNYRLIYETVLQIAISRVLEVGCGRGDHLHNLGTLSPGLALYGIDISGRQIELLKNTYPGLEASTAIFDISRGLGAFPFHDIELAYTQAVLMHIQDRERYERALRNLFFVASKVVVLMENWTRHDFLSDVTRLHESGRLPWEQLFCYYRLSPELGRPHLMVLANCELPYERLTDYSILRTQTDNAGL